jgi:hypothetical protein
MRRISAYVVSGIRRFTEVRPLVTMFLTVALAVVLAPAAMAGQYEGRLTGKALWRSVPGVVGWAGESEGSRSAEFNLTLNWASGAQSYNGGEFTLTVNSIASDGTPNYVGALRGRVSGGVLALDQDGEIASITDATLTVTAGYGAYEGVNAGSGVLTATITTDPEPLRGSMTLSW